MLLSPLMWLEEKTLKELMKLNVNFWQTVELTELATSRHCFTYLKCRVISHCMTIVVTYICCLCYIGCCHQMHDQYFAGFFRNVARHLKGRATLLSTWLRTLVTKMVQLRATSSLSIHVSSVQNHSVNQVSWNDTSEYIQVILVNLHLCINLFFC